MPVQAREKLFFVGCNNGRRFTANESGLGRAVKCRCFPTYRKAMNFLMTLPEKKRLAGEYYLDDPRVRDGK